MSQMNLFSAGGGLAGKSSVICNSDSVAKPRFHRQDAKTAPIARPDGGKGRAPPCPAATFGFARRNGWANLTNRRFGAGDPESSMKDYIPELSEIRMVRRAPDQPPELCAEDAAYVENGLRAVEQAFGLDAFPGLAFGQIPARELIKAFIDWWRGMEPKNEAQREALALLPSAIRLLDTFSALQEERGRR